MTKDISTTEQRPYHHGDLHRAIVEAALDVLSESQSTEFSLRELARRAGVSHNAPYKHFADKRELLAAVSAVGFELLAKRMADATKELDSPRERLAAIARAYVCGGVNNPALYRLMFGGYLGGQDNGRPAIEKNCGLQHESRCGRGDMRRRSWAPHSQHRGKHAYDRWCHSNILVANAWTDLAAGRQPRRPQRQD